MDYLVICRVLVSSSRPTVHAVFTITAFGNCCLMSDEFNIEKINISWFLSRNARSYNQ